MHGRARILIADYGGDAVRHLLEKQAGHPAPAGVRGGVLQDVGEQLVDHGQHAERGAGVDAPPAQVHRDDVPYGSQVFRPAVETHVELAVHASGRGPRRSVPLAGADE